MDAKAKERLDFILGRRSVRVYRPGEVNEETVEALLEAAMAAPSAVAKDPWRFVVVRNRVTLGRLADALPNGGMIRDAELGIIVCGDLEAAHDRQLSYLLQDCSAAIENLLLAVHIVGLGACWLGVHPREERVRKLKEILELPASVLPVAAIAIGWPGEQKEPRTRFNPALVIERSGKGGARRRGPGFLLKAGAGVRLPHFTRGRICLNSSVPPLEQFEEGHFRGNNHGAGGLHAPTASR